FALNVSAASSSPEFRVVSAGRVKSEGQAFTFEESANSLPFIVAGSYEAPVESEHGGIKIGIYMQPGLGALSAGSPETGSKNGSDDQQAGGGSKAGRISAEAGRVIDFLTKTLGAPPAGSTFTIISSVRAGNFAVPGALILNESVFRQDTLDATTAELLADGLARIWIDGRVRVRGQDARSAQVDQPAQRARSAALLRDSMPRYLA